MVLCCDLGTAALDPCRANLAALEYSAVVDFSGDGCCMVLPVPMSGSALQLLQTPSESSLVLQRGQGINC